MFFVVDIDMKISIFKALCLLKSCLFLIAWFRADVNLTKFFLWKSAIYHSIMLPFDAEVAKKILNVIYWSLSHSRFINNLDLESNVCVKHFFRRKRSITEKTLRPISRQSLVSIVFIQTILSNHSKQLKKYRIKFFPSFDTNSWGKPGHYLH